jgi:hypothetical protein
MANTLTDEVYPSMQGISRAELQTVVLEALKVCNDFTFGKDEFDWRYYQTAVAIGFFDGPNLELQRQEARLVGGKGAEMRVVSGFDRELFSWWDYVVVEDENSRCYLGDGLRLEKQRTDTAPMTECYPNFWILEGCYRYMEHWLSRQGVPERYEVFPYDQLEMSLHEELWDIINSFEGDDGRCELSSFLFVTRYQYLRPAKTHGLLGFMNYGLAEKLFDHDDYNHYCDDVRIAGSPSLARAIRRGRRGIELLHAIMEDFNCWFTVRPDGYDLLTS